MQVDFAGKTLRACYYCLVVIDLLLSFGSWSKLNDMDRFSSYMAGNATDKAISFACLVHRWFNVNELDLGWSAQREFRFPIIYLPSRTTFSGIPESQIFAFTIMGGVVPILEGRTKVGDIRRAILFFPGLIESSECDTPRSEPFRQRRCAWQGNEPE